MYMIDLIQKKKQGLELTDSELTFLVQGITNETIPDYQITAWAMAVYFQGMTKRELIAFTKAMLNSGQTLDLKAVKGFKVDKHSTGGVGDKTSLVFAPVAASLGLKVCKMSGKGLGITGGTIDKLLAIPNFKTELSTAEFIATINKVGFSITGQTANLVPADKKLYALRDVSGTIDILELIAASVMSKKIALGTDLILLDVKCGTGAFAQDLAAARKLANLMIDIGQGFHKQVIVVISDMNRPLGRAIGNALELKEVVASLENQGPDDLKELVVNLTGLALAASNKKLTLAAAKNQVIKTFNSPKPLKLFYDFVVAQGGDLNYIKNLNKLPATKHILLVKANNEGYLDFNNIYFLGELSVLLGAGRIVKDDIIDPLAGIILKQVHGDQVKKNQVIMELHTNKEITREKEFQELALKTFTIKGEKPKLSKLILEIIM